MQGPGVVNYSSEKTSFSLTTSTTQFDDELVKRGIVTLDQVMMAKGATPEEAHRLAEEKRNEGKEPQDNTLKSNNDNTKESSRDSVDSVDEETNAYPREDTFLTHYRQERLKELKAEANAASSIPNYQIRSITRKEWSTHVNEESHTQWVLVILWDETRTQYILQDLSRLINEYGSCFSVVTIQYQEANPHWPIARVPAMFAYRNGIKQNEWVTKQSGKFPTPQQLIGVLYDWNILSEKATSASKEEDYDDVD
jgi:hypothetical protein